MGVFRRRREPVPAEVERSSEAALAAFEAGEYGIAEQRWQRMLHDFASLGDDHPVIMTTLDRLGSARFRPRA
jgi:cytochrome c-type biogenesis protein CcmH/NrfG